MAAISGVVYLDRNANGLQNRDEPGVPGVTLALSGFSNRSGQVSRNTVSGPDGSYTFSNLPPGVYRVTEGERQGWLSSTNPVGSVDGAPTGSRAGPIEFRDIQLPPGSEGINYNFGTFLPASISGTVYDDVNDDGRANGQAGLANVTVTLTGVDGQGRKVSREVRTDKDGRYSFSRLVPGEYTITVKMLEGYRSSWSSAGNKGGEAQNGTEIKGVLLQSGADGLKYNFGQSSAQRRSQGKLEGLEATDACFAEGFPPEGQPAEEAVGLEDLALSLSLLWPSLSRFGSQGRALYESTAVEKRWKRCQSRGS
jgi:hypothetical protein